MARDREFRRRLNDRWEFIECYSRATSLRLGKIKKYDDNNTRDYDKAHLINIAEKMLIKAHSPAMNKQDATFVVYCTNIVLEYFSVSFYNSQYYGY